MQGDASPLRTERRISDPFSRGLLRLLGLR